MAAITSAATGNWSAGGTWVGGVAPGAGDTAIIATGHTVTITGNTIIGTGIGVCLTFQGTGSLAQSGGNLEVRGTVQAATNASGSWVVSGGRSVTSNITSGLGMWEWVADLASSTVCNFLFHLNGSNGSRCALTKTAATITPSINIGYGGKFRASYADVSYFGDATTAAVYHEARLDANEFTTNQSTFDNCGALVAYHASASTTSIAYTTLTNCLTTGDYDIRLNGIGDSTRVNDAVVHHSKISRVSTNTTGGIQAWCQATKIYDNVLVGASITVDIWGYQDVYRNYLYRIADAQFAIGVSNGVTNTTVHDNYIYGFGWGIGGGTGAALVPVRQFYNNVVEAYSGSTHEAMYKFCDDDLVHHNILVGQILVLNGSPLYITETSAADFYNNTLVAHDDTAKLAWINYENGPAGSTTKGRFKNSIFARKAGGTTTMVAVQDRRATLDSCTNLDYNCFYDASQAMDCYNGIVMTGKTERVSAGFGLNDIPASGALNQETDPQFNNIAFTTTKTPAQMVAGTYTIDDVLLEYRTAYTPSNAALNNGSGTYVGAMQPLVAINNIVSVTATFGKLKNIDSQF